MVLTLDHLVVSAGTLDEAVQHVEECLGVRMQPGGRHAAMGTHNRLLGLGPVYLEAIAVDPDAPAPPHPRWFGLDAFRGPPRVTNWVARTDDLAAALALAPPGTGDPMQLSRGDLRWTMAVPQTGHLPYGGAFPALIEWHGDVHPTQRLPGSGCRLVGLEVGGDDPAGLAAALRRCGGGLDAHVSPGPPFRVTIATPSGERQLA